MWIDGPPGDGTGPLLLRLSSHRILAEDVRHHVLLLAGFARHCCAEEHVHHSRACPYVVSQYLLSSTHRHRSNTHTALVGIKAVLDGEIKPEYHILWLLHTVRSLSCPSSFGCYEVLCSSYSFQTAQVRNL